MKLYLKVYACLWVTEWKKELNLDRGATLGTYLIVVVRYQAA